MKVLALLILGITPCFGADLGLQIPLEYELDSSQVDSSLNQNEATYVFSFIGIDDNNRDRSIDYSIDGVAARAKLTGNSFLTINTTPGKHSFQFYYNENHFERYIDSLEIASQHKDMYSIYMQSTTKIVVTAKPVIYLYPQTEQEVEVKLNIHGRSPLFYPKYSDGWKVKASPDGTLHINEREYNYLFWEAQSKGEWTREELKEGFIVPGEQSISFLEDKLTQAGLTSKEQADFITFWTPLMMHNTSNFVRFEFNESCDQFAELNITPRPDEIYRIYIRWAECEPNTVIIPQEIIPMNREGFVAIEWGGQKLSPIIKYP